MRILDVHNDFQVLIERQLAATEFNSIAWCDTEPILATCAADDGLVRVYTADDLQLLQTLEAFPGKHAYGLAFVPGGYSPLCRRGFCRVTGLGCGDCGAGAKGFHASFARH